MTFALNQIATTPTHAERLHLAAQSLAQSLATGQRLDAPTMRGAMQSAFGADETSGAWVWRDAYDAAEMASFLFLRRFWPAIKSVAPTFEDQLNRIERIYDLMPSQSRRSQEQDYLQQFSTPLPIAFIVALAAKFQASWTVLEPSAGTGALAIWADLHGSKLRLNEIASNRNGALSQIFPNAMLTAHNGSHIHGFMRTEAMVDCIIMNPPFSADIAQPLKRDSSLTHAHVFAAWQRLKSGGRLVAVTGANIASADLCDSLTDHHIVRSISLPRGAYQKHGVSISIRVHVIDKSPSHNAVQPCEDLQCDTFADAAITLESAPIPSPISADPAVVPPAIVHMPVRQKPQQSGLFDNQPVKINQTNIIDVGYQPVTATAMNSADGIYQPWRPTTIHIPDACDHPSPLAEASAMAMIQTPMPTYQPRLPEHLIKDGILSSAQLESVIYAGEAHSAHLPTYFNHDPERGLDILVKQTKPDEKSFQLRQGWFLGDGTGAGKGRQVAAIILDNYLQGRKKALWISKSSDLLEDARRDWTALGQNEDFIIPLTGFSQGAPINAAQGILYTTYATLRRAAKQDKISRLAQITDWLGKDFDGTIIFDESHHLAGAAGGEKAKIGKKKASQQGIAGLSLQNALPDARVVYVSATGASTVNALAYANRLGLWDQELMPFDSRQAFVNEMEKGGVPAIEVVARDLKALGLYQTRNLSYDGVVVDILTHDLTTEQTQIYDSWADAYQIIHTHLSRALEATNIEDKDGTYNSQAKSNAKSAFESSKQRFFNHMLNAMKCPSLFRAIENDLRDDKSVIVQIVSTGEAIMNRALANIPSDEHGDLNIDITPKDNVIDYLTHSFPTHLYKKIQGENGQTRSEPIYDQDGRPVEDPVALEMRDQLIEKLLLLPPLPTALDQLIWRFGSENVAEITGRSRRIIRNEEGRLQVQRRPSTSGKTETDAFMNDSKRILIFSEAGGTGRSYHADSSMPNNRQRVHYLLEPGWRADAAIQGLGRSNRTGQSHPPIFRPVTTNVKGEKRFIATIAKRLDTLGALTRGQRSTANQGMFKDEDNFETEYAKSGLALFYRHLQDGKMPDCSIAKFEAMTGLVLKDSDGALTNNLPEMHTFLNRMLALTINMQNSLFAYLETLIGAFIATAKENGTYELGVETITADELIIEKEEIIPLTIDIKEQTKLLKIRQNNKMSYPTLDQALSRFRNPEAIQLLHNTQSGKVAISIPTDSKVSEQGGLIPRVCLQRPHNLEYMDQLQLDDSHWQPINRDDMTKLWQAEIDQLPEYRTSVFFLVTGLLLPIWDSIPSSHPRLRRIIADTGTPLLGRLLEVNEKAQLAKALGLEIERQDPTDVWDQLQTLHTRIDLNNDLQLKSVLLAGKRRVEIVVRLGNIGDWLKRQGCITERVNYQIRFFAPDSGVLAAILQRYPI